MNRHVVIYGGPKTMHLARLKAGYYIAKVNPVNKIIITGTEKGRKRARHKLQEWNCENEILEVSATNTIEEVAELIALAESEQINLNKFVHISQEFHLKRIEKIWKLFNVKLSDRKSISTKEVLGISHTLNKVWRSNPDTKNVLANESRWNKGLSPKYWEYWLIPVANSNISKKYWKKAKKNAEIKLSRREVKNTKRELPPKD